MVTALLLAPAAGATGIAHVIGVDALRDIQWMGPDGAQKGVDGLGVPILTFEGYDRSALALEDCYQPGRYILMPLGTYALTGGAYLEDVPRNDIGNLNEWHGSATISTLCGAPDDQSGDLTGIAPAAKVWSAPTANSRLDLSEWFDGTLKLITWSRDSRTSPHVYLNHAGAPPNYPLLVVASAGNSNERNWNPPPPGEADGIETMFVVAGRYARDGVVWEQRGADRQPWTWPSLTAPGCMWYYRAIESGAVLTDTYALPGSMGALPSGQCPSMGPNDWFNNLVQHRYTYSTGSSLSAPVTAATAALMLQVNPDLMPVELKWLLERTADPFLDMPGMDDPTQASPEAFYEVHGRTAGYGYLNATHAVAAAHYLWLHPEADLNEAIRCGHTGLHDGVLWLNPGPRCPPEPVALLQEDPITGPREAGSHEPATDTDDAPDEAPIQRTPQPGLLLLVALLALTWRVRLRRK